MQSSLDASEKNASNNLAGNFTEKMPFTSEHGTAQDISVRKDIANLNRQMPWKFSPEITLGISSLKCFEHLADT